MAFGQAKPAAKAAVNATTASASKYRNLKFPPLRDVEIPKVDKFTLPNGMRVY